jgi:hypothetical protein
MGLGLGLRCKFHGLRQEIGFAFANAFRRPNLYDLKSPERLGCVFKVPSDMCLTDRIMLYALVRGLRPRFAVEIGVRWGSSARISTAAMRMASDNSSASIHMSRRSARNPLNCSADTSL